MDSNDKLKSGIYRIKNKRTGKIYVGSAVDIRHRWILHRSELRLKKHRNIKLQRSWNKHGSKAFVFNVLEYCPIKKLISREQFYIDRFKVVAEGYNIAPKAGSTLGYKHTLKSRKKLSLANKGNTIWLGKKHLAKSKLKMSQAHILFMKNNPKARKAVGENTAKYLKKHPEIRRKFSRLMKARLKKLHANPVFMKRKSKTKRDFYRNNPEEREITGKKTAQYFKKHPEARIKFSKVSRRQMKKLWKNPDFRKKRIEEIHRFWRKAESKKSRKNISVARKLYWKNKKRRSP